MSKETFVLLNNLKAVLDKMALTIGTRFFDDFQVSLVDDRGRLCTEGQCHLAFVFVPVSMRYPLIARIDIAEIERLHTEPNGKATTYATPGYRVTLLDSEGQSWGSADPSYDLLTPRDVFACLLGLISCIIADMLPSDMHANEPPC